MAYRCEYNLNGEKRRVVVARGTEETDEHLALRLAAFALFWDVEPQMEISPKHPALAQVEFKPDFIALDAGGEVALWGECGNVSINKLDKLTRRYPHARIAVLKASPAEGRKMRADLAERVDRGARVEVLSFRPEDFALWKSAVGELLEVFGECAERSMNLVVNHTPLACDLQTH